MPKKESNVSPRRLKATERQNLALQLRLGGRPWQEIAEVAGYASHSGAIAAVKTALARTQYERADEFRTLTLERLTTLLYVFWPNALRGDLGSAKFCMDVIKNQRDITGIDMPSKVEHSGPDGEPIRHEVVKFDANDFEGAVMALREAGVVRVGALNGNGTSLEPPIYPPQTDL